MAKKFWLGLIAILAEAALRESSTGVRPVLAVKPEVII
jgi:hypothetical protein